MRIDINCDMGEYDAHDTASAERDAVLMRVISSASIACGGHAGGGDVLRRTLQLAAEHGVAAGAHPGFEDRAHFGRRELPLDPGAVYDLVSSQLHTFTETAREAGVRVRHVKPHGALYNMAARDDAPADAIARAVRDSDPTLLLFGLSGSRLIAAGRSAGLRTMSEVFADRSYEADGSLTLRSTGGAVISDAAAAAARVLRMVRDGRVTARTGNDIIIEAQTVCVHSDSPGSVRTATALRSALERAGVRITAPGDA